MKKTLSVALAASLITLTACTPPGTIVQLVSKSSHGIKTDEVQLPKRYTFDAYQTLITQLAKAEKYDVSVVDRNTGTIGLAQSTSMLRTVGLGSSRSAQLKTVLQSDGRTVTLELTIMGNQSSYKQEKLDEALQSFKDALLAGAR